MPSLAGATEWLNSERLTPADLHGRVVLIDLGTRIACTSLSVSRGPWKSARFEITFYKGGVDAYAPTTQEGRLMSGRTSSTTHSDVVRVADANDRIQAGVAEPVTSKGKVVLRVDPRAARRPWHLPAHRVRVGRPSSGCPALRKEQSP
jgi:hypothetical protein